MTNDTKIKKRIEKLEELSRIFLREVGVLNPTAYSDSILEEIIKISSEIEELYK